MPRTLMILAATCALGAVATPAPAQEFEFADYQAPPIVELDAQEIARFAAPEALQGAAVDRRHVYAVFNFVIGKYDKKTFERRGGWEGPRGGPIRHINSCYADMGKLYCAHSNFPETPMASSVEIFETRDMSHASSLSLGAGEGSLTWFDRKDGDWWAGFAHYDGKGGEPNKDHRYTSLVRYDDEWRKTGQWFFPASVLERMAPHSASGGAFGPDGLLYVTGHDRTEMYALRLPEKGSVLEHVASIAIDIEGQAFAWDRSTSRRIVYGISRPNREIRAFEIPEIPVE